jgi:phosphoribosyl-ATP pyrophosphohydrolase/phosphoribosyl-AMP cyclohydrolase
MNLNFKKGNGLIPVIIQDDYTNKVLMLGFMNQEALKKTKQEGKVTFYSRTKKRLWTKGETSGNFLYVKEIITDCDNDTLLIKAEPAGPVCHEGSTTCFGEEDAKGFLYYLENIINDRRQNPRQNSYTSSLFKTGISQITRKVGEEAIELIIEAGKNNDILFLNEAADLIYHFLVLLNEKNLELKDVEKILSERHLNLKK